MPISAETFSSIPADGKTRKVTRHAEYDVLWPSGGPGAVVYENGGYIYRYDPTAGSSERVPIRVYGDLPHTFPYFDNVASGIASVGHTTSSVE